MISGSTPCESGEPYLLVGATELETARACARIVAFVGLHAMHTLNVAGPRQSGEPRAYDYARRTITLVLERLPG